MICNKISISVKYKYNTLTGNLKLRAPQPSEQFHINSRD